MIVANCDVIGTVQHKRLHRGGAVVGGVDEHIRKSFVRNSRVL